MDRPASRPKGSPASPAPADAPCRVLRSWHGTRSGVPNVRGVFADRPVAREAAGRSHIQNGHARPGPGTFVQCRDAFLRIRIGGEIGQVHVIVTAREERLTDWRE